MYPAAVSSTYERIPALHGPTVRHMWLQSGRHAHPSDVAAIGDSMPRPKYEVSSDAVVWDSDHGAPILVVVGAVVWGHGFQRPRQFPDTPSYRDDSFAGARIFRKHVTHGSNDKWGRVESVLLVGVHPSRPLETAVSAIPFHFSLTSGYFRRPVITTVWDCATLPEP